MITHVGIVAVLVAGGLVAGPCRAEPPTDDQIRKAVEAYQRPERPPQPNDPRAGEALKGISIEEMSAAQFEMLGILIDVAPTEVRARFRERLAFVARQKGVEGAVAASQIARLVEMPGPGEPDTFDDERVDALLAAGDHPGFPLAVKAGRGTTVYYFMYFYAENERMVRSGLASRLSALVNDAWPAERLGDLMAFTEAMIVPGAGLARAEIDRLRSVTTGLAQRVIALPETDAEQRDMLLEYVKTINSAAAKGELVGSPAPAMHFLWTNSPDSPKTLDDLRGKVVVLDFWATWCGPCIGAFPHMREVQERYKGSRVAIVGITSLQGWIQDGKAPEPAKKRAEKLAPEDEIRQLGEWVKKMDMTWTVGVTKEDVFNPAYAVRGIPTIVIIDAKGVVRHAGLSPRDPRLEEYIDELLKEAGAEPPARRGEGADPGR